MSRMGIAIMAALLLVLTACGAQPSTSVANQFRELVDRPAVLDEAENRLIRECMNGAGMTYPQVPVPHDERPILGLMKGPAPLRPADARKHGYPDTLMRPEQHGEKGPVEVYADALPPGTRDHFYEKLRGSIGNDVRVRLPDDFEVAASSAGCIGRARHRLYGSVGNFLTVFYVPELVQRRVAEANDDQDVRTAVDAYGPCMTARGYNATTPTDAVKLALTYYPDGRRDSAGLEEIALATADAECREVTQLPERRTAAVERIVRRWLADNGAVVSDTHSMRQAALAKARTIMSS